MKGFTSSPPYLSIYLHTRELIDGSVASHCESPFVRMLEPFVRMLESMLESHFGPLCLYLNGPHGEYPVSPTSGLYPVQPLIIPLNLPHRFLLLREGHQFSQWVRKVVCGIFLSNSHNICSNCLPYNMIVDGVVLLV